MASSSSSALCALWTLVRLAALVLFCQAAYTIRLSAVEKYGRVIHEFDPWFNYRVTQYIDEHGYANFTKWYDYQSWWPLGRPVGTTTYPGMMITASAIYRTLLNHAPPDYQLSLNDVCVFVPAWFGVASTLALFLLAWECSGTLTAAVAAAGFFAILPAHLMRSVAGGFDNESVAVFAIIMTFYLWVRSLRTPSSWPIGALCAVMYTYMVFTWGAYPFVLNMIGFHTAVLFFTGGYSSSLHHAYSLFFVIGTAGALQLPIVGLQPLQSLEQMGPMAVFLGLQVWEAMDVYIRANRIAAGRDAWTFRIKALFGAANAAVLILLFVVPDGYFGPLSARIRGLFVPHTKTGNPLVDSVAEHQATNPDVYMKYFHVVMYLIPVGLALSVVNRSNARIFMLCYALISFYFSQKMMRLVLLMAPPACLCAGHAVGTLIDWSVPALLETAASLKEAEREREERVAAAAAAARASKLAKASSSSSSSSTPTKKGLKSSSSSSSSSSDDAPRGRRSVEDRIQAAFGRQYHLRKALALAFLLALAYLAATSGFVAHCFHMGPMLSEPQIMMQGHGRDGQPIMIDDFREAYFWLRDNTPRSARILSWWDYGYQINGMGERTTLADGNTWNHEHIALVGRCLVTPEEQSYNLTRHLADYVLVWSTRFAGMYGDDLAKMAHIGRIASSVYKDVPGTGYWMDRSGQPSENMKKSLLYKLHSYRLNPAVDKPKHFEEVYTTKHYMIRIYKVINPDRDSKKFGMEQHAYPPAIHHILKKAKSFSRDQEKDFLKPMM